MAEYINIKGQNIEVVASDPANPTLLDRFGITRLLIL
jgi:hypothetical protein